MRLSPSRPLRSTALAAILAAAAVTPASALQSRVAEEAALHQAFWLEVHDGALEEALAAYESVASDASADAGVRAEAEHRAAVVRQDLVAGDMTQLLPAGAIAYAELSRPGEHLADLLRQLGLYADGAGSGRFGVAPELVQELVGARGLAVAITGMPLGGGVPTGVVVLHPGDLVLTRGLLETALPAEAAPADSIEGYATWSLPVQPGVSVYVTLTERLVIASNDVYEVGAVVERMQGYDEETLANDAALARALEGRHEALLSICVNARPILPMVHMLAEQALAHDPEAAMALQLADVDSLRAFSAHVTAGEAGLGVEATLELAEGHRSLVFDLLRRPTVERETLALVPAHAAFAFATALNPAGGIAPLPTDANGRPIVSTLDLGRELFGNLIDVALFGVPGDGSEGPLPDVALVLRSNDTARTTALFELALGLATQASSGGRVQATDETVAGVLARRYDLQGVPLYVAAETGRVVVSPSRAAIARSVDAASGRGSILDDPLFAPDLARLDGSDTLLLLAAPGRLARMAAPFAPAEARRRLGPLAALLDRATLSARVVHDDTRLGLDVRLRSLPDVSALVSRALRGEDPFATPLPKPAGSSAATQASSSEPTAPSEPEATTTGQLLPERSRRADPQRAAPEAALHEQLALVALEAATRLR